MIRYCYLIFLYMMFSSCVEKNRIQTKPELVSLRTSYFTNDNRYVLIDDLKTVNYILERSNNLKVKTSVQIKPFVGSISVVFAYLDQDKSVTNLNNQTIHIIFKDKNDYIISTPKGKYINDKFANEIIDLFLKGKQEKY